MTEQEHTEIIGRFFEAIEWLKDTRRIRGLQTFSLATPAATMFFAIQRAAYAAERSTFEGSFPEKAPPP